MSDTTITATAAAQGVQPGAAGLGAVRDFFGMGGTEFRTDWMKLSDKDKADLRNGIGDGTFTY